MVCRASLGNAPDFGVRIHSASGLSGECVRTGQIVRCDDTENDPRVDPVLCRELKLRCALILPLYHASDLCGVLEVFSARPFAFAAETVSHLQQVSQVVVEVVSGMMSEPGSETGMPGAQGDAPAARVAPQLAEESVQAPTSGAASDSAARESRRPVKTAALSDTIPCDVCGYANHRGQRICSKCDVPLSVVENFLSAPTSEQVREVEAAALLARSRYGVGERLSPAPVVSGHGEIKRDLKPLIGMGTLLVLIFLGFGLWRGTHSKVATQQPQAPLAAQSQPAAAQSQPAAASSATPVPSAVPAVAKTKKAAEPAKPKPASAKTTLAVSSSPGQEAASVRWIMGRNAGAKAAAEVEPAPLPVSAGQIPHLPYIVVVPEPPRMEAPASAAHTAEPASGGAITGGNLIRKVAPVYPPIAKSVGKQGSVVLTGTVDRQGMLKNLRAIEGDPMLIAAAIDAAQKWRYEPYRLNGSPIEIETKIVFHFRQ
jgi:TonB family protein